MTDMEDPMTTSREMIESLNSIASSAAAALAAPSPNTVTDDESNGFVIVKQKASQEYNPKPVQPTSPPPSQTTTGGNKFGKKSEAFKQQAIRSDINLEQIAASVIPDKTGQSSVSTSLSHNRSNANQNSHLQAGQYYDSSLGIVLNVDDLDRDSGAYKYQRRPVFEWFSRWLR